jgi:hypothetical protein
MKGENYMNEEWLEVAYVGEKVILHGRLKDSGTYEAILTAEQNETLRNLSQKHDKQMSDLLWSFVDEK